MASLNPFDLLGDDDAEDPMLLLAAQQKAAALPKAQAQAQAQPAAKPSAKLPSKPLPPTQAVRESRNEGYRGGRGGGRGFNRDLADNGSTFGTCNGLSDGYKPSDGGDGGRAERRPYGGPRGSGGGGFRGGRRGGFSNGEAADGERPRRTFDRRSGTGRGMEMKRDGAGRANWGAPADEIVPVTEEPINEVVKNDELEKQPGQDDTGNANKESCPNQDEVKEPEEKEMTLEEYESVLEEKRKALISLRSEERKVELDKELKCMQLLSNKKNDDDIFIKLGSEKDKRKEATDKTKKSVSINEFLKPAEGDRYRSGGRGRGRGLGRGGSFGGNSYSSSMPAPAIEDAAQFPALVAK